MHRCDVNRNPLPKPGGFLCFIKKFFFLFKGKGGFNYTFVTKTINVKDPKSRKNSRKRKNYKKIILQSE